MNADAEKMVTSITGNSYVQLQTASVVNGLPVYPTLYVRTEQKQDTDIPTYKDIDHLRLRAFLIPGQVTDLSDLQIVIESDCGTFTQELKSGTMTSGYIHKISLKYFKQRGTEFDYTKWMSQLDPTIYVNELSIPGAWHAVNPSYQATTDFTEMYDKGIRGFEFHVNVNGNIQDTETSLSTALQALGKAIQDHGGKGFVMVEIGDPYSSEKFPAAVNAQLELAKDYIYQTEITANTTIKDVAGKIIIKINTNDSNNNANESGWTDPTPALFSRWQFGSKGEAYTEALQWGQPIAPDTSSSLYWCFTEADNTENGNVGGIDARKSAIDDLMKKSLAAWSKNEHDTWYECGVGGYTTTKPTTWGSTLEENPYTNGSTSLTNYQNAAAILNLYLLGKLSDPNRTPSPLGLILMNFCTGTTNYPEAFGSAALIRTIINNNSAFILNRAGAAPKNAADEHNVVVNNGGNAVE